MNAAQTLHHLAQHVSLLHAIHYSCQTLGDSNEGLSPRITSIAVLHIESSSMHSFSIHLAAEQLHVGRDDISAKYDDLEREMLKEFYSLVQGNQSANWLHWNMSNINYGFEAIDHRFKVLTGETPPQLPDSRRFNLSSLISGIYGSNYVDDPKMLKLMELNGGRHRDFLSGAEEAQAFEQKEFIRLHKSTMTKVYFFQSIYKKLQARKLQTAHTNFWNRLNEVLEKPLAKLLGFFAVLFAIFQFVQAAVAGFPLPK